MSYKLGSLFDGSGGFPLAGALCGIEPVWASEVEPYPIAVTKSRFPKLKHLGDISKINGGEIEPVDIITFGSPCQDLSVAGKRAGLKHEANGDEETTRSGLFMEAVRIIKEMRNATDGRYPTFALWENVPGAFSSNKGEDFKVVLEELIKIVEPSATMPGVPQKGWNYADSYIGDGWSLAYRVLDAQYWGVPQRRRRIYLVTDFRGQRAREILFEREGLRGYFAQGRTPWQTTPTDAQGGTRADDREGEIPYTLKIRSGVTVDSRGKAAGKGALIQENLAATLGVTQDQYLFQPTGVDPYNGDTTGDKSSTLGVNCGVSTGRNAVIAIDKESYTSGVGFNRSPGITIGGPCATLQTNGVHAVCYDARGNGDGLKSSTITGDHENRITDYTSVVLEPKLFEFHGQDVRLKGPLDVAPTAQAGYGEGGSTKPLVIEQVPFCKSARGKFKGDAETWKDAKVANTLNTFDQGETRANEIICMATQQGGAEIRTDDKAPTITAAAGMSGNNQPVICLQGNGIDRADNAGCNGKGWKEDTSYTLNTIDRPAVVFAVDQGGEKSSANVTEDKAPTLCTTHGGEPAIAHPIYNASNASFFTRASKDGPADTLVATDYKDPQLVAYGFDPSASRDVGALFIEECGKTLTNGTCPGHHDGVVIVNKPQYIVRRLTPTECARLQGFADRWGGIEEKKTLTTEEYNFWLEVRNTHAAINGKKTQWYTKAQMLTWYNKLQTDSSEYKMWGNGIALPTALYVLQGIEDALFITELLGE